MAKQAEPDFIAKFINERVSKPVVREKTVKAEDGTESVERVELKRRETDFGALFALAKANGIDTTNHVPHLSEKNGKGRVVMMISNSLRAAGRKRLGLYDADKNWHDVDDAFKTLHGVTEATETADGVKIKKAKPVADTPVADADGEAPQDIGAEAPAE